MAKKKQQILQIDPNFSFEKLVSHVANVRAEDVDEAMKADSFDEHAPIDEENGEPPEEC